MFHCDPEHGYLFQHFRSIVDQETLEDAWLSFTHNRHYYTLEGEICDWFVCALYVSSKKYSNSNSLSLTRIIRHCSTSLVRFFNKFKNWVEMGNLPNELKDKLEQTKKNFFVTSVIFRKYQMIFSTIFQKPLPPCRFTNNNRKNRKQPLNSMDIFTFCWTLFVYIKSRYTRISDDLVNSYHLLFVCIDYCFSSLFNADNCSDLICKKFYEEIKQDLRTYDDSKVSIIEILCNKWFGNPEEIHHIRVHWFESHIKKLRDVKNLKQKLNGIIGMDVIDNNFKYIKKEYDDYVTTIGDLDECVFLDESASKELGIGELNLDDVEELLKKNQEKFSIIPKTPLSSQHYLASRTPMKKPLTPITTAIQSISRLHSLLKNCKNEPSEELRNLFKKYKIDPELKIKEIITKMGEIFIQSYVKEKDYDHSPISSEYYQCVLTSGDEFARNRLEFSQKFFYYILEKLLNAELSKRIPDPQLISIALSRIVFNQELICSLFVCCLGIILFSYILFNDYSWILNIYNDTEFKITPFSFYKVIEPIIREEKGLTKAIINHLSTIEEKILDNLAWKKESPLWDLLLTTSPPSCAEVSLDVFKPEPQNNDISLFMSPAFKGTEGNQINLRTEVNSAKVKIATRQLFNCKDEKDSNDDTTSNVSSTLPTSFDDKESTPTVQNENVSNDVNDKKEMQSPISKNPKNSQISLFFRKVYSLASLRLRYLFKKLQIESPDIQLKIWTCFEHALKTHTHLMRDRHLDQIIMCAIYGVAKINLTGDRTISFQNIIEEYRHQPHATNAVYRQVLLSPLSEQEKINQSIKKEINENSNESIENADLEKKNNKLQAEGTIIDFYNTIFVPNLQTYVMKFSPNELFPKIPLSPMPKNNHPSQIINSPLRCVPNYPVFVSPLRSSAYSSPSKPIVCRIQNNQSISEHLEHINTMMRSCPSNGFSCDNNALIATVMMSNINSKKFVSKRILQDDNDSDHLSTKQFCSMNRKIIEIVSERQLTSTPTRVSPIPTQ